jgi:hypothetical protein
MKRQNAIIKELDSKKEELARFELNNTAYCQHHFKYKKEWFPKTRSFLKRIAAVFKKQ